MTTIDDIEVGQIVVVVVEDYFVPGFYHIPKVLKKYRKVTGRVTEIPTMVDCFIRLENVLPNEEIGHANPNIEHNPNDNWYHIDRIRPATPKEEIAYKTALIVEYL